MNPQTTHSLKEGTRGIIHLVTWAKPWTDKIFIYWELNSMNSQIGWAWEETKKQQKTTTTTGIKLILVPI
jgi:hypothetical protein